MGHTFAMPAARSSQEEIERALSVLASRDSRYLIYRRLADRAGVALDPLSCWLLFRIQDQEAISQDRFTLIALDALEGYGDEMFMEVKLWSQRADELASESLYA